MIKKYHFLNGISYRYDIDLKNEAIVNQLE